MELVHAVVYRDSTGKKIGDVMTYPTAFDAKEAAAWWLEIHPEISAKKSAIYVAPAGTDTSDLS